MLEYKLFDAPELTIDDVGPGSIVGYASTFVNFDDVGDRVVKGAFARHLGDFLKHGFVAIGHNWSALPIASPVEAYEDDHGLFVKADFHTTNDAQAARTVMRERMERGKSVRLSIGFETLADEYTEEGRLLKDVRLFEWSYVTVPAHPLAMTTGVKGISLEGGPPSAYADVVEAAIAAYTKHLCALEKRRTKAGRVFSEANLATMDESIATIQKGLDTLRDLRGRAEPAKTEPKASAADTEGARLLAEFQRTIFHINGALYS